MFQTVMTIEKGVLTMKAFMDKEFMLQSPTAQHLYHAYAADMPICDYHSPHSSP